MESWTAKDWAEFLGAVSLFVSAILTAIWGKNFVVGASTLWKQWQEIRNAKYEQRLRDEELNDKGHKFIIRRLDKRVTELEKALEAIRTKYELQIAQLRADYEAEISLRDKEHMRCREEYAALKVEAASLRRRVEYLEKERRKS